MSRHIMPLIRTSLLLALERIDPRTAATIPAS